ncbi:hypothetical protein Tsubulata_030999 [Turnera subulata]|uniref:CCHC-type domain-containing protein n=1 Tax=Turnera subulata TaxID=218843 RepID=A0A9Q0IZA1_9ROSI|nr:hypothetical protein Tsubulata_030999 [Turnera subulata]
MDSTSGEGRARQVEPVGTDPVIGSDSEEEVLELEDIAPEQQTPDHWGILARVLGSKHVNPQAFSNLLGKLWNPCKGMEVEQVGRNFFLFQFFAKRDRQEVLEAETLWFFEKRVVVMKEITGDEVLTQVDLNEIPIWVQLHNIPWNQRSQSNVMSITLKAGTFICFDEKGEKGWGRFVRFRINMHVEKPIRRSVFIRTGQGTKVEVSFRYEGLPNFCYLCGRIDHLLKDCDQRSEESDEEERTCYGEWLRASPRKPFRLRTKAAPPMTTATRPEVVWKLAYPSNMDKGNQNARMEKDHLTATLDRVLCLNTVDSVISQKSHLERDNGVHQASAGSEDGFLELLSVATDKPADGTDQEEAGGELSALVERQVGEETQLMQKDFPVFTMGSEGQGYVQGGRREGSKQKSGNAAGQRHQGAVEVMTKQFLRGQTEAVTLGPESEPTNWGEGSQVAIPTDLENFGLGQTRDHWKRMARKGVVLGEYGRLLHRGGVNGGGSASVRRVAEVVESLPPSSASKPRSTVGCCFGRIGSALLLWWPGCVVPAVCSSKPRRVFGSRECCCKTRISSSVLVSFLCPALFPALSSSAARLMAQRKRKPGDEEEDLNNMFKIL